MTLDADINTPEIELRFEQIAKMLFKSFAIKKGETVYLFKEIEFYFYNKNHRDIITHPRVSKPLCWIKLIIFFTNIMTIYNLPKKLYTKIS